MFLALMLMFFSSQQLVTPTKVYVSTPIHISRICVNTKKCVDASFDVIDFAGHEADGTLLEMYEKDGKQLLQLDLEPVPLEITGITKDNITFRLDLRAPDFDPIVWACKASSVRTRKTSSKLMAVCFSDGTAFPAMQYMDIFDNEPIATVPTTSNGMHISFDVMGEQFPDNPVEGQIFVIGYDRYVRKNGAWSHIPRVVPLDTGMSMCDSKSHLHSKNMNTYEPDVKGYDNPMPDGKCHDDITDEVVR